MPKTVKELKLTPVTYSSYCQFSQVEYKLAQLYYNQEVLLEAIKILTSRLVPEAERFPCPYCGKQNDQPYKGTCPQCPKKGAKA